jgi:hypothetical protein
MRLWSSREARRAQSDRATAIDPIKLTVSEPWEIKRDDIRQTRPYLYDMGKGLLLMSVAQGPDAFYEPYGLLKSTDAGKTWTPIPGLDKLDTTPLPCCADPMEKSSPCHAGHARSRMARHRQNGASQCRCDEL